MLIEDGTIDIAVTAANAGSTIASNGLTYQQLIVFIDIRQVLVSGRKPIRILRCVSTGQRWHDDLAIATGY